MNPCYIKYNDKFLNHKGDVVSSPYVWKSYEKAENFLTSWMNSKKCCGLQGEFEVQCVFLNMNENIVEMDSSEFENLTIVDDDDLLNMLKIVEDTERKLSAYRQGLNYQLADIEKQILDLQHYVELSDNQSVVKGYTLYKMDKDLLKTRRVIKDQIFIIDETFNQDNKECYSRAIQIKQNMSARNYVPRSNGVAAQLFEEKLKNRKEDRE